MARELVVDFGDDEPSPDESFANAKPVALPRRQKPKPHELEPQPAIVAASTPVHYTGGIGRTLPHSLEAEEILLSNCLLDGADTVRKCLEEQIKPESFYDSKHGIIYNIIVDLYRSKRPIEIYVVAEELKQSRQLDAVGGYSFLTQVTSRIPTSAEASYFIDKVRGLAARRQAIRAATGIVEDAYTFTGDIDAFLSDAKKKIEAVDAAARPLDRHRRRKATEFSLVSKNDRSVLLGNRYLNRGDIAVLSSTSGMGKSSMALQMAVLWALGLPAFGPNGIACNGPLTSLILQSEDSDGDVAEVMASIRHVLQLDDREWELVGQRVHVITDRVNRGAKFIASLRRHIDEVKPDLVWINPLQAFMDGDITESKDIGAFLREGLNSLNEPPEFAYMLVHHTTKPSKDPKAVAAGAGPRWSEVMYDMAGGAEIINASRAILSLRATETEGDFNLVLAKRGRRAGAVKEIKVQEGMSTRLEPITTIPLKHAAGFFEGPDGKLPVVFWEGRAPDAAPEKKKSGVGSKYTWKEFQSCFPAKPEAPMKLLEIHRRAAQVCPMTSNAFYNLTQRFVKDGAVEEFDKRGETKTYRAAL